MRAKLNPAIDYIQRALTHADVRVSLWRSATDAAAVRRHKTGVNPTDGEFITAYFGAIPLTGCQIAVQHGCLVRAPRGLS
jgi:hypothetical protein